MDIQFRCSSTSHFDASTGSYRACQQMLQVSGENVGLKVRCPRCNQLTVVPAPEANSDTRTVTQDFDVTRRSESVARVEANLSYGKYNRRVNCPKCGTRLTDEKKCPACRYVMPLVEAPTTPLSQIQVKPAGFQLWFRQIMADGVGATVFEYALHSLLTVAVVGCLVAGLLIGGANSVLLIFCAATLAALYILIVVQTKRLSRVPMARIPFYLKPFWILILYLARAQKWQNYDSELKGRRIIDLRGENCGDRELLATEDLNVCQVLDAEGTNITDNSLAAMHGLKHLRCLVLRKTHVTPEAIFRLQQSIPRCWIWY